MVDMAHRRPRDRVRCPLVPLCVLLRLCLRVIEEAPSAPQGGIPIKPRHNRGGDRCIRTEGRDRHAQHGCLGACAQSPPDAYGAACERTATNSVHAGCRGPSAHSRSTKACGAQVGHERSSRARCCDRVRFSAPRANEKDSKIKKRHPFRTVNSSHTRIDTHTPPVVRDRRPLTQFFCSRISRSSHPRSKAYLRLLEGIS